MSKEVLISYIIFNGLNILSSEDTLDEIIKNNRSILRFGDGEIRLIFGKKIGFQNANKILAKKLKKVLKSKRKGLLIGINFPYNNSYLNKLINQEKKYYINWIESIKLNFFSFSIPTFNDEIFH